MSVIFSATYLTANARVSTVEVDGLARTARISTGEIPPGTLARDVSATQRDPGNSNVTGTTELANAMKAAVGRTAINAPADTPDSGHTASLAESASRIGTRLFRDSSVSHSHRLLCITF